MKARDDFDHKLTKVIVLAGVLKVLTTYYNISSVEQQKKEDGR